MALAASSLLSIAALPSAAQAAGPPTVAVANPAVGAVWPAGWIFNITASDPDGLASARFILKHLASGAIVMDRTVAIAGNPTSVGGPNNPVGPGWNTTTNPGPDGRYEILMRATDSTGTSADAKREFTYDTTSPTIAFTTAPVAAQPGTAVTWAFRGDDGPSGSGVQKLECRIDSGIWSACPGADHFTATSLSLGNHQLDVRATDGGGHTKTESRTVTVDGTAPTVAITGGLADGATVGTLDPAVWSFDSIEPGRFECRVSRVDDPPATWGPCRLPTSHRPGEVTAGAYVFQVRALDLAGNVSEPASRTFTFTPDAPSAPQSQSLTPGAVAPVEFRYTYVLRGRGRKIVVSELNVSKLSTGATLTVSCKGAGCPKRVTLKRRGSKWRLSGVSGRALPRGTEFVITATKPGATGKTVRLKLVAPGKPPKVTERCLAPGSTKPGRCPKG